MSDAWLNRAQKYEIKENISNSMTGKTFSENKLNLSPSKGNGKKLTVFNLQTKEELVFNSKRQAEISLGFPKDFIGQSLRSKSGLPYRGIYKFTFEH